MIMRVVIMILALLALLHHPAAAQTNATKFLGSTVRLKPIAGRRVPTEQGELIATSRDSLWLLLPGRLVSVPRGAVFRVRVNRKKMGAGLAWAWAGIGAVVTGAALTGACSTVSEDCGGVFLGTAALWALVGAIAAPSIAGARWENIDAWGDLPPHTRFPQGLPPGVDYQRLTGRSRLPSR
jgi:hypothetical protein